MEKEIDISRNKNTFPGIFITQAVYTAVILAAVLILKFFFTGLYSDVRNWYLDNFTSETSVSEVLGTNGDENEN